MFDRQIQNTYLSDLERKIEAIVSDSGNASLLSQAEEAVRAHMLARGVDFEGRDLPMSLRPLLIGEDNVLDTGRALGLVRRSIGRIIALTRRDIRQGADTILTRFFSGYETWFDLIGAEVRHLDDIMLMRFDTALDAQRGWLAMEPNAACPGGVIHCAYLRAGWQSSDLGRTVSGGAPVVSRAIDDPSGFVRFLESVIDAPDGDPHAVICNYDGTYTNELDSLVRRAELDRAEGRGKLTISTADIRELESHNGQTWLNGRRVDLIYNKLDPLEIDPNDPETAAWRAASRSARCEFLNSFGAFYIGEAKSVFAALHDPEISEYIGLTAAERDAIQISTLPTFRVKDQDLGVAMAGLVEDRANWVLKEDATTRGIGVVLGEAEGVDSWAALLQDYALRNGVLQRAVNTPTRQSCDDGGREFYGADWFFFGSSFAGCVSRAHVNKVFNVGNGGREVPVLVCDDTAFGGGVMAVGE